LIGAGALFAVFLFASFSVLRFTALFVALVITASKLYSRYLAACLRVRRREAELRAFRYTWVEVEAAVENTGRLPAYMLALHDSPGGIGVFRAVRRLCALGPGSRAVLSWHAYCGERGVYTLGPATVRGSDPLGLFPFRLHCTETAVLFVYPAPAFAALANRNGIPVGALAAPEALCEDLARRRSLRPYQAGDEPRRINWRASARAAAFRGAGESGFMVNEYDPSISAPLVIFLNICGADYSLRKRGLYIERAIEAAAALALAGSRQGRDLGLIIFAPPARIEPAGLFSPSAALVLERLAAAQPSGPAEGGAGSAAGELLRQARTLRYGTRVLYVGPNLEEEAYRSLNTLRRCRLSLEYFVIDEAALGPFAPGHARRYQITETGYAIL
jgi:uncharacterized protein (DUF58 family)